MNKNNSKLHHNMNDQRNDEVELLRQRVKDLELTLGQSNDSLAVTFKLTPVLNNLMGLLLSLPNVTPEMIRQRLEIAPDAKVAIHRLRKHLDPFGIKISSRRNLGYWLEDETKLRIRQMLAEKQRAAHQEATVVPQSNLAGNSSGNEHVDDAGPEDEVALSEAAAI